MLVKTKSRIGIIGAGAWGTALGKRLAERGHAVQLWCYERECAEAITRSRTNSRYLMGVRLPSRLTATTDLRETVDGKDFLLLAVPSLYLTRVVGLIADHPALADGATHIGVLTKGFIESRRGILVITDALETILPACYRGNLVYISGPSHAEEVARGKITGLISASRNGANAIRFRQLLSDRHLLVFSSLDVAGVQICAALKNVVAIAFGLLDALSELSEEFGDNTESLLMAAGLNEIQRLGMAMGATHPETFTSIAGVGDLDVTCRSRYGRNRRFGREIILDRLLDPYGGIDEVIADMGRIGYFAEGVVAARYADSLARRHRIALPICQGVYRIINRDVDPAAEVENIIRRLLRGDTV